jgi:hypothetical protein
MAYTHEAVHLVARGQGEPSFTPFAELEDAVDYAEIATTSGETAVDYYIIPATRVRYTA